MSSKGKKVAIDDFRTEKRGFGRDRKWFRWTWSECHEEEVVQTIQINNKDHLLNRYDLPDSPEVVFFLTNLPKNNGFE